MNKLTKESGLKFNVIKTNKAMVDYLKNTHEKTMVRKDAPIYMTGHLEKVFLHLCTAAGKYITKEDNKITFKVIKTAIKSDKSLMNMFVTYLYNYNSEDSYEFTVFDNHTYIDLLSTVNKDYILTESGKNFFRFLLGSAFQNVLNIAFVLKEYKNNSSIGSKEVQLAIQIKYEGDLLDEIQAYSTKAVTQYTKYREEKVPKTKSNTSNKTKDADSDNACDEDMNENEEVKETSKKKNKKSKNTKQNIKKKLVFNSDSDSDSDEPVETA